MMLQFNVLAASILSQYTDFEEIDWNKMWEATKETLFMTIGSVIIVFILGLAIGLILYETSNQHSLAANITYRVVSILVNVFRSIPFIILIVLLIPVTKQLLDTMVGPKAALPALIVSSAPFYARLVETGFREIDKGVVEAVESMGANKWQVIFKVLIPESLPSIAAGITTTTISLVGFTAMAAVIGAGGLGNMAYLDGFQRNKPAVTLAATVIILIIVFLIQGIGDRIVRRVDKR